MRNEEWETLVPGKDKLKFKFLPSAFGSITVRVINTRWGVLMKKSVLFNTSIEDLSTQRP